MSIEKNDEYFGDKSELEKIRNVANMVDGIVNTKSEEPFEVQTEDEDTESEEIDPVVDLVGKAIKTHKPRGMFMQGVTKDGTPSL